MTLNIKYLPSFLGRLLSTMKKWPTDVFRVWKREMNLAFHDQAVIIFFVVLCAVYPLLYSLIYNTEEPRDVEVVVVDDSRSALSREITRNLDASPKVAVMQYAANMQEARSMLNNHECYGIVHFPSDFARNVNSGTQGHISLYCDMSVLMRYKQIFSALTDVQLDINAKLQAGQLGIVTNNAGAIIESEEVALGNTAMGVASAILPCILVIVLQQSMILGICTLRAGGRERRLMHRGRDPLDTGAGVTATIIGKMLCHWAFYIVPTIYVLYYVPMIFDFPQNGNIWEIMMLMVPFLLATSLLGQTLQVFVNDRESTFLTLVFTSVVFVFLSGISWPRYMMSDLWLMLGNVIPSTWASNAYVAMHSTGASLEQVSEGYWMLWLLCGAYFVAACLVEAVICRPRYRRMQHYAAIEPDALLNEERRRNAVDSHHW